MEDLVKTVVTWLGTILVDFWPVIFFIGLGLFLIAVFFHVLNEDADNSDF